MNVFYLNLDSAHLNDIIFLEKKVVRGSIILELHKSDDIVHTLDHVYWRECWLSCLQVEIIDVICWVDREHALHKISVSDFVNLEKLLVIVSEYSLHIST